MERKRNLAKKIITTMLVALLSVIVVLGCAKPAPPPGEPLPKALTFGGGVTGGTNWICHTAIAAEFERQTKIPCTVLSGPGAVAQVEVLVKKELDLIWVPTPYLRGAFRGEDEWGVAWKEKGKQPIRLLATGFILANHMIVDARSPIKTYADLRGKRVYIHTAGAPLEKVAKDVLFKAWGVLNPEKELGAYLTYTSWPAAWGDLVEGRVDAASTMGTPPTGWGIEIAARLPKGLRLLGATEEMMKPIKQEYPFMTGFTIPAKTYKGMDEDVLTNMYFSNLVCHRDLHDEVAYRLAKLIFEKQLDLTAAAPPMRHFSTEWVKELIGHAAYHPGAIRYYKEAGVWTKELDKSQAKLLADIGEAR